MGICVMCRRNNKEPSAPGVKQMKDGEIEDPGWRGHGRPDHVKPQSQGKEVDFILSERALKAFQQKIDFGRTVLPSLLSVDRGSVRAEAGI